ncbi:hypothetical protein ACA910_000121 [Epithemia clementina (nom. ined.)]
MSSYASAPTSSTPSGARFPISSGPQLPPLHSILRKISNAVKSSHTPVAATPWLALHAPLCGGSTTSVSIQDILPPQSVTSARRLVPSAPLPPPCSLPYCVPLPLQPQNPDRIEACSLHAGGAVAVLCASVDTDIIKLVGRWRLVAMFRYLHAQALPVVHNLAATMFTHGQFVLAPGADLPPQAAALLRHNPSS